MFPYWLLFAIFALASLAEGKSSPDRRPLGILAFLCLVTGIMVGLRFQVGADFETYQFIFRDAANDDLANALDGGDPGYQFVNWFVGQLDGSMWHVNLVCAGIFSWGLYRFCRLEPLPCTAALVAVPYLIVVVAMGYTRQAVAIGLIMAGLGALMRGATVLRFAIYVAVAALFHRTAVIVLPLAIFAGRRNNVLNAIAIVTIAYGLYDALLAKDVEVLVENYIEARYSSQGAGIRVAMNIIPAVLILFRGKRLGLTDFQLRLWRMVAVVALLMIPALFLVPSTTAIDRIALYLLPIQIVALGRLPLLFTSEAIGRVAVAFYCFCVLFVWLNFAAHAHAWIPYRLTPVI